MRVGKKEKKQTNKNDVLYFLCVERALVFCVVFFHVWNALWYFVLYFSACGTCSCVLFCIFLRVEHALIFCVKFFCVLNVLWYFCYIFPCVERALIFFAVYFLCVEFGRVFCVVYLTAIAFIFCCNIITSLSINSFSVCLKLSLVSAVCYSEISCYIFPRKERALVLWNFVLYSSTLGTRTGIVKFCSVFFCV